MARGLLVGFLVGAIAAGVLMKLLGGREEGSADGRGAGPTAGTGEGSGGSSSASGDAAELKKQLDAALESRAELAKQVASLRQELEEVRRSGGAKPRVDIAKKWQELAAAIQKAKEEAAKTGQPMKNDTWLGPLLALIGHVADEMGVSIGEAVVSPEWYPMFSRSILENSPFPLSEQQRAAFDTIMSDSRTRWDEYMKGRDDLSPLEKAKALRELQFDMFWKLGLMGTQEQKDYMASLNMPPPPPPFQTVNNGAGPREAVKTNISNNLSKSLGLDPNQMTSLGPVIDDYMRRYDALKREVDIKAKAGEPFDEMGAKIGLALETQKRIGETVRLTEAQAKALREWTQVHDYQVKE
jgi:hypothetical protein